MAKTKTDEREVFVATCTYTYTRAMNQPVTVHEGDRAHAGHWVVLEHPQYFLPETAPRFSLPE